MNFTDSTQIPIHLNIIQAFVILLTYSPMIPNSQPILDYWFPPGAAPPQAFLLDATNVPVQILPDWLKLKMIRSPVERLVDAALLDLTPDQIVLFVQNFGTPVNSMSKLLALLDRAVIEQFETVKQAILNKAYLAQLIEIQQQRGAKNGHIAVQALDLHAGKIAPDPTTSGGGRSSATTTTATSVAVDVYGGANGALDASAAIREPALLSRTKEIEEVVELVLSRKHPLDRVSGQRVRRLMQQLIGRDVPDRRLGARLTASYGTADNMQSFTATKVLQYLHRVVQSSRGPYVLQNLQQTPAVCSLFRSLLTWQPAKPEAQAFVLQVVDQCAQHLNAQQVPVLCQIVRNKRAAYVKATGSGGGGSAAVAHAEQTTSVAANGATLQIGTDPFAAAAAAEDLKQYLERVPSMELEVGGKRAIAALAKNARTNDQLLVGAVTRALLSQAGERSEKIGLLVDWLANIDSELVRCPAAIATSAGGDHQQLDLLFARSTHQFRFYLLSLLSHQASWSTLSRTVGRLLTVHNVGYEPSAVLHFIEALIGNPKLWQGRDKATPKHEQSEPVLQMSGPQVQVFADYALAEATTTPLAVQATSALAVTLPEGHRQDSRLSERVKMLLRCVRLETFNLRRLVRYVRQHPHAARDRCEQFLQLLYMNMPQMKCAPRLALGPPSVGLTIPSGGIIELSSIWMADAKPLIGCQLDVIAQYALTAIASLTAAREWQSMSAEMELIVRKLAATHPALMLRHLSVLAALLQGRAHMDWPAVRQRSLPLFNQVLGLLELLQPHLFAETHRDALHQAMDCYFTLLRHHGHKDIYILLYRFMELLQAYTNHNANRALHYVEQYAELMQHLSQRNRNVAPLQQLVQGISLLKHRHAHDFRNLAPAEPEDQQSGGSGNNGGAGEGDTAAKASTTNATLTATTSAASTAAASSTSSAAATSTAAIVSGNSTPTTLPQTTANAAGAGVEPDSTGAAAVILAPYTKNSLMPAQWPVLVSAALRRDGVDILPVLQEIENVTFKRHGLLEPLFERLLDLVDAPHQSVRSLAHELLVRHLKHQPGEAAVNDKALAAYVRCLRDNDPAVVQSALGTLTEMVICLQENAAEILQLVFDLGIRSKLNTSEPLRRCVLALKTQHAC